jgi:hypothetical protein
LTLTIKDQPFRKRSGKEADLYTKHMSTTPKPSGRAVLSVRRTSALGLRLSTITISEIRMPVGIVSSQDKPPRR